MAHSDIPQSQSEQISRLLDELTAHKESLSAINGQIEDKTRTSILAKAESLIATLETPMEWTLRKMWQEPSSNAAVRLAVNLGIFRTLSKANAIGKTCKELASVENADPQLISRTLRHLASTSVIKEVSADTYTSTPLSQALAEPKYEGGIVFCFDAAHPSFLKIPSFFFQAGYRPVDKDGRGPFQAAHNTTTDCFGWLQAVPSRLSAFHQHMSGYNEGRPAWMTSGFYPVRERLSGVSPTKVLLVDVGGGIGHDLALFRKMHPDLPGRLVLQDLDNVVAQSPHHHDKTSRLEIAAHDFFTPQPVLGAKAYFLHSILHNWSEAKCQEILSQLKPAMRPNYSKILINENVVPATGASWQITSLDWMMMGLLPSRERTEEEWRELLASVGLKIVGIWTKDKAAGSLIEAVLEGDEM